MSMGMWQITSRDTFRDHFGHIIERVCNKAEKAKASDCYIARLTGSDET